MSRPLFLLTLRQSAWLAALALLPIGYALYLRHQVIEQSTVGIACGAASTSWLCISRRTAILLFTPSVFGVVAILLASENAVKVSLEAIQALGGAGYTKDWPVERFARDAKLLDIGAGTSEIRRMLIGRELIGAA